MLLGQPLYLLTPEVVGFRFVGQMPEGTTATDLVLTVTQMLRQRGVVGRFVEFTGSGLSQLGLADRATISNMCPEYGATAALFPVDDETLRYLRLTGRDPALVDLVERYSKEQGLFRTDETPEPQFSELLELDLRDRAAEPGRAASTAGSRRSGRHRQQHPNRVSSPVRRLGQRRRQHDQGRRRERWDGHASSARGVGAAKQDRVRARRQDGIRATRRRWPSRRLPAARTPRIRSSCSGPACSPRRRSKKA